jgi:glycosyltransferase involved in cell wall biosynthesis
VRVLLLTDWYPAGPDDLAGVFVREHALALQGAGHEVRVLHLTGPIHGAGPPRLRDAGGGDPPLTRFSFGRAPGLGLALNLAGGRLGLARLVRGGFVPEIVHAHEFGAGLVGVRLARRLGVPAVISEHLSLFALGGVGGTAERIARRAFAAADVVCPASDALRDALVAAGYRARFEVVPNPVDTELFRPATGHSARPASEPARVVVVASLKPVKGVDLLVEAVALLERTDLVVEVIGDGPEREALTALIRRREVSDQVRLVGAAKHEALPGRLQAADFAVVPSRFETFSVAAAEAQACGLPIVACDVGALAERVGRHGLLCRPEDPAALAAALGTMLDGHRTYDRSLIAADARARYGRAAIGARWTAVYAGLPPRGERR